MFQSEVKRLLGVLSWFRRVRLQQHIGFMKYHLWNKWLSPIIPAIYSNTAGLVHSHMHDLWALFVSVLHNHILCPLDNDSVPTRRDQWIVCKLSSLQGIKKEIYRWRVSLLQTVGFLITRAQALLHHKRSIITLPHPQIVAPAPAITRRIAGKTYISSGTPSSW